MQIVCQTIVIHYPLIFKLIRRYDRVITLMKQLRSVYRFVASFVATTFFQQNGSWDAQTYFAVNVTLFVSRLVQALFGITLQSSDLVSQEGGSLASGMGNERLFLRKGEFQLGGQKLGKLPFNSLRFRLWPDNYVSSKVKPF
jgi:hypothetical protein